MQTHNPARRSLRTTRSTSTLNNSEQTNGQHQNSANVRVRRPARAASSRSRRHTVLSLRWPFAGYGLSVCEFVGSVVPLCAFARDCLSRPGADSMDCFCEILQQPMHESGLDGDSQAHVRAVIGARAAGRDFTRRLATIPYSPSSNPAPPDPVRPRIIDLHTACQRPLRCSRTRVPDAVGEAASVPVDCEAVRDRVA